MQRNIQDVARESRLQFLGKSDWSYNEEQPHITSFRYDLALPDCNDERLDKIGTADGYRISQDWTVENDPELWDEADSLDGDVVRYVEALIREFRACESVFDCGMSLSFAQRITILRHVDATTDARLMQSTQAVAACLAMMDAPVVMLVDPWPMSEERRTPSGKLQGRMQIPALLDIGFVRMVGSRFLWRWNRELSEGLMAGYSYDELRAAKKNGALDEVLKTSLSSEVYGELPQGLNKMVDVPEPDDFDED